MKRLEWKETRRHRRKMRIRRKIRGDEKRPRISVYRSNRHFYLQAIDDTRGHTLAAVSTLAGEGKGLKPCCEDSAKLGKQLGAKLKAAGVETAVYDRNGRLYHGVVQAAAEGIREAGIRM